MERLTEKIGNTNCVKGCGSNCKYGFQHCRTEDWENCKTIDDVIDKFAQYEELEERLNKVYGDCDGLLLRVVEMLEKHPCIDMANNTLKSRLLTDEDVDKWEEYKQLEEQGRLIKLPCKVGDTMYGLHKAMVCELDTETIGISKMPSGEILYLIDGWELDKGDFGKTVFLTKSEAEQKLNEMESD